METATQDLTRLIRIENDYDRHVLLWLRRQVGDDAIRAAIRRLEGKNRPYLSAVCRALEIQPPARRAFQAEHARISRAVGDRYLARIRQILSSHEHDQGGAGADDTDNIGTAASYRQRALPFGAGSQPMRMV